ncbi:MAG: 16S rRNA (guanine(966)-N(2))-methyltransferase RsmD [Acidimicrobiaceae bacterium]|jgi:16S rRNA (guanine(966)-N(2))-methyltransferase RsmD|nr:16S rRNA (guanine(966)-N(2))-methyltransferase RsmD [Acidimicrobiaceae bacterium]|tara:strand:- start:12667 stop:13194 length:528 start_codon:yes stop_codon:yes gene_type:complete
MRVISGEGKGRKLIKPSGDQIRPTKDRVKEAIFNSLHSYALISDNTFLDLFSGTGSLGIEALSRGAKSVVFTDNHDEAINCISLNVEKFGYSSETQIHRIDALSYLERKLFFDVVLLDPPYGFDDWKQTLALIEARIIVIESSRAIIPDHKWRTIKSQKYGQTHLLIATDSTKSA